MLAIATFAQAAACLFVQSSGAVGPFLVRDLRLNATQLGLLLLAAQLVPVFGLLVAGELLDRYNERWVVGVGTLVVAAGLLAGGAGGGYPVLLACLLVVGAGYSTAQPGGSLSVSRWFPESQRGLAMGIRQAGLPVGGAMGAALLPALAGHFGWRASLLGGGAVAALGGLIFMILYRSPGGAGPPERSGPWRSVLAARLAVLRLPSMRPIMLTGLSLVAVQYGFLLFVVLYLHEVRGMDLAHAAFLLFIALCAGAVGRIGLAWWGDHSRGGRLVPVLACLVAAGSGLVALMFAPLLPGPVVAVLIGWLGFFGYGWYGPWVAYVAESAPVGKTGFALGLAMAVNQVAAILVPPLLGVLRDGTHGYRLGWGCLALLTAAALAAVLSGRRVTSGGRLSRG